MKLRNLTYERGQWALSFLRNGQVALAVREMCNPSEMIVIDSTRRTSKRVLPVAPIGHTIDCGDLFQYGSPPLGGFKNEDKKTKTEHG